MISFCVCETAEEGKLLLADKTCTGTCPGGDLSLWGFGGDSEKEMIKCCRPLRVQVFELEDKTMLERSGWKPAEPANYTGMHGIFAPQGEGDQR